MNQHLQKIVDSIGQQEKLSAEEKVMLIKAAKDADKDLTISEFNLDRTEKLKRTADILLEETIEELEQKRKTVELQNKELEIETALERVRARTMAMRQSAELADTASILFQQIKSLGFETWSCGFGTWQQNNSVELWMGADTGGLLPPMMLPYTEEPTHKKIYKAKQKGELSHTNIWNGKALEEHYAFLRSIPSVAAAMAQLEEAGLSLPSQQCYYAGFFNMGYLLLITKTPNDALEELARRFASVFDLTYTRFLDLQKAEAQAREAQIENALEKVRSRSLAMHKSDELQDVVNIVFERLQTLHIDMNVASIYIFKEGSRDWQQWVSSSDTSYSTYFNLPYTDNVIFRDLDEARQSGIDFYSVRYPAKVKNQWFSYAFAHTEYSRIPEMRKKFLLESEFYQVSFALSKNTGLQLAKYSGSDFSAKENEILKRFCRVFEQAYTRFLDLQKAEAQAREAQTENALEKVRSRTMAMQHSDELGEVSFLLNSQVRSLGIKSRGCAFNIYGDSESTEWFSSEAGTLPTYKTPRDNVFQRYHEAGLTGEPIYIETFEGNDCKKHYDYMCTLPVLGDALKEMIASGGSFPEEQTDHVTYFKYGYLLFITLTPLPEGREIFIRFAKVFEQTYTRFLDLQRSEAQTREAQIEAALERVRSRTLAMQKSEELAETAAVLFQQLILLGIEPNRLYISILKDENGASEFWITEEDGTKVSTAFAANLKENGAFLKMYKGWQQQKKSLVIDMEGEELENYFSHLASLGVPFSGGLAQKRRVQDIAYFSHGFIGIASPGDQPAETMQLLERFAAVFNLTFTRFNDLQLAEAHAEQAEQDLLAIKEAKQKAEMALTELQAAQKQLIQSEKMASLGELTAGIAHEIQNPLNFVNNFSEVSKELLDEMKAELDAGHIADALDIAKDIIENLQKINHHGKRADAIVKGMLQHSRISGNQKELTDINALVDEYIRLCYHGLRAKDKSFNSAINTNFDAAIEKVNIIPQDIGRVVLNILTNAFYAVTERRKIEGLGYSPSVSVSTKGSMSFGKGMGEVVIQIADNGVGIPRKIVDKIFQPFFTTKPTGQGTGLGLSLSYDIVKAHGGELKVETKEGEGTTFIIQLFA